jgi:hypothetical protein
VCEREKDNVAEKALVTQQVAVCNSTHTPSSQTTSPPIASHRCAHDVIRSVERAGRLWADLPGVQTPTPHTEATVASSLTKTAEHTRWNSSREFLTDRSQTRNQRPRTPKRHVNNRHKNCTSLHAQGRLPLSSIHSDRKLKDFMCVVDACLL